MGFWDQGPQMTNLMQDIRYLVELRLRRGLCDSISQEGSLFMIPRYCLD